MVNTLLGVLRFDEDRWTAILIVKSMTVSTKFGGRIAKITSGIEANLFMSDIHLLIVCVPFSLGSRH